MATTKKSSAAPLQKGQQVKPAEKNKAVKVKTQINKSTKEDGAEELVVMNIAALSQVVESLSETVGMLVQKVESMAFHIIATEEMLAEIVADNGINLARVNARIRLKIAAGTDGAGNSVKAIDVAARIASPLPKR